MKKLLLADADVERSITIFTCLEQSGFIVELATDGAIAINALDRTEYDVILVSEKMPDMDGRVVCERYIEKGRPGAIVILAQSSEPESLDGIAVDEILEGEIDEQVVLSTVQRLLGRAETAEQHERRPKLEAIALSGGQALRVNSGVPVHIASVGPGKNPPAGVARQAGLAMESLARAMAAAGGSLADIAALTVYVRDAEDNGDSIVKAIGKSFGEHLPVLTMVGVVSLAGDRAAILEISATAYVDR